MALAVLTGSKPYEKPKGEYHGTYYFDPRSIRIFAPISQEDFAQSWPGKRLSNARHKLDSKPYAKFKKMLKKIRRPRLDFQ